MFRPEISLLLQRFIVFCMKVFYDLRRAAGVSKVERSWLVKLTQLWKSILHTLTSFPIIYRSLDFLMTLFSESSLSQTNEMSIFGKLNAIRSAARLLWTTQYLWHFVSFRNRLSYFWKILIQYAIAKLRVLGKYIFSRTVFLYTFQTKPPTIWAVRAQTI